jgi:hypothetical protein
MPTDGQIALLNKVAGNALQSIYTISIVRVEYSSRVISDTSEPEMDSWKFLVPIMNRRRCLASV